MKMLDKLKKALQDRVNLMLECAYKVAVEGGYSKDKETFLIAVRDSLDNCGKEENE